MTENEAKRKLDSLHYKIVHTSFCNKVYESEIEALCIAKDVLEEIQQYRALGTVRQIEDFIADWRKFRELGNLEELREAMEKQRPKIPHIWGDGYPVYDMYECPGCGENYEIDSEKYDFCPRCGQKLDWRE